jgi:hypothetical protein
MPCPEEDDEIIKRKIVGVRMGGSLQRPQQKFRPASATPPVSVHSKDVKAPWGSVFKPENALPSEMEFSRLFCGRLPCSKSGALVIPLDMTLAQPGRLAQTIFPLPC